MPGTVLVLTHQFDPTDDLVVDELNRRDVPLFRADIGQFPGELTATAELASSAWSGVLRLGERAVRLDAVTGVYYRRPTGFRFAEAMSGEEKRWATIQARLGFGGVLAAQNPWLNHPHMIAFAEYKPVQLAAARAFVGSLPRAVCKPFGGNTFADSDGLHQIFCTGVTAEQITGSVRHTAHLFQERVPKSHEIRLTVVDDEMFAARIDAGSAAGHQDWRSDYRHLAYSAAEIPDGVGDAVRALLRRMRLRFAALDFVVDHDGRWWFVELNPNGQWGWIEDEVGFPIATAVARALAAAR